MALIAAVLIISLSLTLPISTQETRDARCGAQPDNSDDVLVDAAIQMIRGFLKKNHLDPMKLPDMHVHTDTKILGVKININFDATDLVLKGLATLEKTDELEVKVTSDNTVKVRAVLQVSDLSLEGETSLTVSAFGVDVASVHVQNIKVLIEMEMPGEDSDENAVSRVNSFDIQDIGSITIKRGHDGTFNSILDKGISFFVNRFREIMKNQIGPLVFDNLNKILS